MLKSIDHFALIIAISERQACHTARMQQIQYYFLLCNYSSHAKKYSTYNFTVMKWGTNFDEWLFVFDVLVYGCVPIVYCRWPSKVADWRVRSLASKSGTTTKDKRLCTFVINCFLFPLDSTTHQGKFSHQKYMEARSSRFKPYEKTE